MALTQEAINDAKLAEAKIANATSLSDDYKKNLLNLIAISTTATNGISQEEKIQKMTDAIRILAISQVDFVTTIQTTIINTIQAQNKAQCENCKAMKHAVEVENQAELEQLHQKWREAEMANKSPLMIGNNTGDDNIDKTPTKISWIDTLKNLASQPGFWIFASIAILSPYTIDVIKAITSLFIK